MATAGSKPNLEMERWREWWNKRPGETFDIYELIRGTPDLLSNQTKMFLTNKIFSALELRENDILVDAGCGVGDSTLLLHHHCQKIIGIDHAENLLRLTVQRSKSKEIARALICASISAIPLKDSITDKLICESVLQYIPEKSLREVMEGFRRITKDNGIVVICCKNNFTLTEFYHRVMRLLSRVYHYIITKPTHNSTTKTAESLIVHYSSYRFYRKLFKETLGNIEEEWSFALFSWKKLKRFKMNRNIEKFELWVRQYIPFLLRPFGIEYYFKIRVQK
ncbi:methylase [subsurface metagenome]